MPNQDFWIAQRLKFDEGRASPGWRHIFDAFITNYCGSESPIESLLADALRPAAVQWGYQVALQHKLGRFRYDIALIRNDKPVALIECDGRQFHSTPEQLANDAAKDRLAREHGLLMFRFSGQDICRDAAKCAEFVVFHTYPRGHR